MSFDRCQYSRLFQTVISPLSSAIHFYALPQGFAFIESPASFTLCKSRVSNRQSQTRSIGKGERKRWFCRRRFTKPSKEPSRGSPALAPSPHSKRKAFSASASSLSPATISSPNALPGLGNFLRTTSFFPPFFIDSLRFV